MMGKKDGQMKMVIVDMESLIPDGHLLKKIDSHIDFSFIYEKAAPYYSSIGRRSVDPVCMVKMLLIGYLYGIKSERRLTEDISLNLAFRWFCGFELNDKIPDHSLFSQNRRRRFSESGIFNEIFIHIVRICIEKGIVTGAAAVSDGSFIPGNVAAGSLLEIEKEVEQSTVHYLDALDEELKSQPGYKEPVTTKKIKTTVKSSTDPDRGYISQERKKGLGYLTEMTVDAESGIVLGVDCYPANRRESDIILKHIKAIKDNTGLDIKKIGLDAGYDVGAVHRGLELLGIEGYVSCIDFQNDVLKRAARYLPDQDCFECAGGRQLHFVKLIYKKPTQNYYRLYRMPLKDRKGCPQCSFFKECAFSQGESRINASAFYPSFYRNRLRYENHEYKTMKRLRSIWSEGTFAVLKREHNLVKMKKRGLFRAKEECLLSALALNLKRMIKVLESRPDIAVYSFMNMIANIKFRIYAGADGCSA